MESNGKGVDIDGNVLPFEAGESYKIHCGVGLIVGPGWWRRRWRDGLVSPKTRFLLVLLPTPAVVCSA